MTVGSASTGTAQLLSTLDLASVAYSTLLSPTIDRSKLDGRLSEVVEALDLLANGYMLYRGGEAAVQLFSTLYNYSKLYLASIRSLKVSFSEGSTELRLLEEMEQLALSTGAEASVTIDALETFILKNNLKGTAIEQLLKAGENNKAALLIQLSSWENTPGLFTLLNNNLGQYPLLIEEMAANPKLLYYFSRIKSDWYTVLELHRQVLKGELQSPAFAEMIGDIEVTYGKGMTGKLKTITLEGAQHMQLGDVFDYNMEQYISSFWRNVSEVNLPPVVKDRLLQLKNQGYELVFKPKVSIGGSNPEPDMLFIKYDSIVALKSTALPPPPEGLLQEF